MPNYSGIWTEQAVMQAVGAGNWANVPGVPTGVTATNLGATSVSVAFTAPTFAGIPATITSYTVTSSPGGITASGASSPITVTGLTTGTPYTFTVTATNASGTSSPSAASNSVTPALINYIEDVYSTYLYTGTGSAQTITNGIDLSTYGGLVWTKNRVSTYNNVLIDTARGTSNFLMSDQTSAQLSNSTFITSFNSTGYTLGTGAGVNAGGENNVGWTFRKQPKFFDVVTYTGNGSAGRTVAHSLGSVPGCIIIKRTDSTSDWPVYHAGFFPYADQSAFLLNSSASTTTGYWNNTLPTSTVFSVSSDSAVNASGGTYVAYLFANQAGGFGLTGSDSVVACGSAATGSTVTLGWEPQWILTKTKSAANWKIYDTMRGMPVVSGGSSRALYPNTSDAESNADNVYPTATGFTYENSAGVDFLYVAIRRGPMKVPTSGTSVFYPLARTGTGSTANITGVGFAPDLVMAATRDQIAQKTEMDRLRGVSTYLTLSTTATETTSTNAITAFNNNGITVGADTSAGNYNYSTWQNVNWFFGRAPSFFDEVCYTGTGTAGQTYTHNLGVAPELMIVKNRTTASQWLIYQNSLGNTQYLLFTTAASASGSFAWNNTSPTSSVFSVGTSGACNTAGENYVAYLFATCAGVSKVGSYTGTGALQTVDCGFAAGARFVLIKRTDSTGDWYTYDSARGISSSSDPYLFLNSTAAEVTGTNYVDTTSVGFQVTAAAPSGLNANGGTYIFLAIA